jgi:hypothetical protein
MDMQPLVFCVVEGHGEVDAVPGLVRRIGQSLDPPTYPDLTAFRIPRSKLVQGPVEIGAVVRRRGLWAQRPGGVLVVLDADDDCPVDCAKTLVAWATEASSAVPVGVVLADREFESWFLAGIDSLRGHRGISAAAVAPPNSETVRDAKGQLNALMPADQKYRPNIHQAGFAARLDIDVAAGRSRSLRKFVVEVTRLLSAG